MGSSEGIPSPTCSTNQQLPLNNTSTRTAETQTASSLLTRSVAPTSGRSHPCHCPPCPLPRPHPLTGLPAGQRWGCSHRPPAPGRGRCCAAAPQLTLPWQAEPKC